MLATGDFTHPAWRSEIKEILVEAEPGLFRLADPYVPETVVLKGGFGPKDVRFILNVEISSIYKRGGATRKVHNLIFMPDLDSIEKFSARLDRIGNINSDGRPILGLDSRDLLEIALSRPARLHSWFPLIFGHPGFPYWVPVRASIRSKNVSEIWRLTYLLLETGLSSDPEMNHRVSALDRFTLISNSDTHSPARLGREANIFQGALGYLQLRDALVAGGSKTLDSVKPEALLQSGDLGSGMNRESDS